MLNTIGVEIEKDLKVLKELGYEIFYWLILLLANFNFFRKFFYWIKHIIFYYGNFIN
jgi:hypothetical protein